MSNDARCVTLVFHIIFSTSLSMKLNIYIFFSPDRRWYVSLVTENLDLISALGYW